MAKHGLKAGKFAISSTSSFQVTKKRQGNTVINSEATTRAQVFSDVDVHLSGEAAQQLNGVAPPTPAATEGETDAVVFVHLFLHACGPRYNFAH